MQGLRRYRFDEKAASVRRDIIELVRSWGFHEYFDPFKGTGYGTEGFSWTAALFLDVALEELEPAACGPQDKRRIPSNSEDTT
jgi:hypothetical protein